MCREFNIINIELLSPLLHVYYGCCGELILTIAVKKDLSDRKRSNFGEICSDMVNPSGRGLSYLVSH